MFSPSSYFYHSSPHPRKETTSRRPNPNATTGHLIQPPSIPKATPIPNPTPNLPPAPDKPKPKPRSCPGCLLSLHNIPPSAAESDVRAYLAGKAIVDYRRGGEGAEGMAFVLCEEERGARAVVLGVGMEGRRMGGAEVRVNFCEGVKYDDVGFLRGGSKRAGLKMGKEEKAQDEKDEKEMKA
ncbi:hypothetical protein BDV95DRAFT_595749 [Massariosphaeria phaeospora]|uniref:RRM domain-containing protein n=1 Tax=Massariosphaeria phaeospora TaxID=100035 RepID=A0A7C8I7M5_9PLEO|nr:hypothetical protein BDV95DRAFT_595749 [Massariosphaeria phaeospora]